MTGLVALLIVTGSLLVLMLGLFLAGRRGRGSDAELAPLVDGSASAKSAQSTEVAVPPDARAFIIVKHVRNGYLILNAFKERKGQHGQLPGGRINVKEGAKQAAIREFFEETGILVTETRVKPLPKIGNKYFFFLELSDDDQVKGGDLPATGESFRLKLSEEHVSFSFYKNIHDASKAVLRHSGGTPADALEKYASELGI